MGTDNLGLDLTFRSSADNSGSEKAAEGVKHVGETAQGAKGDLEELGYSAEAVKRQLLELVAFAEVVAQFKDGAREVMALEKSFNSMEDAAGRFGKSGEEVKGTLKEFAEKLGEVAGIADHESIPAMSKLYGKLGDLDEVLARALVSPIVPIEWTAADELAAAALGQRGEPGGEPAIRH